MNWPLTVEHLSINFDPEQTSDGRFFCVYLYPDRNGGQTGYRFSSPEEAGKAVTDWLRDQQREHDSKSEMLVDRLRKESNRRSHTLADVYYGEPGVRDLTAQMTPDAAELILDELDGAKD